MLGYRNLESRLLKNVFSVVETFCNIIHSPAKGWWFHWDRRPLTPGCLGGAKGDPDGPSQGAKGDGPDETVVLWRPQNTKPSSF